ncbi:VOC family protein [Brevibacillus sp. SAFN-007a]|uniref:VOC family protein n=1 Tax=Brevibacillus sp. SAFN-007a TaxID=3436862 RepID=UPI003F809DCA
MITHFAELKLQTVSLQRVEQVYADRLGIPVLTKTDQQITFALTPHVSLSFEEGRAPISPAHFAFQVPYSKFYESAKKIRESGLLVARWEDGHEIDEEGERLNLYFTDGDGNLLEIIAHKYVQEDVLVPCTPLHILYVREVGCPVESVPVFREWLKSTLHMKTVKDQEVVNFVIGGTAHIVANWCHRPWIPIAMKALPPNMHISFGTPDRQYVQELSHRLKAHDITYDFHGDRLSFVHEGYSFSIVHTPAFDSDIPRKLNVPCS